VGYPASHQLPPRPAYYEPEESGAGFKVAAVLLGVLVAIMAVVGLFILAAALTARNDARDAKRAAAVPAQSMVGMPGTAAAPAVAGGQVASPSFAGIAPANADALAMAHAATPAALPAAPTGDLAAVTLAINDSTISIAPGIRYRAWTFGGTVPGPVIHVRQGQLVRVTLVNRASMPHSVDFHAARVAPNIAFADVATGGRKTFSFRATDPGVFMYHCGTPPTFMHIANGMYGAIIVEPRHMPPADKQYVLVSSEWYLNSGGEHQPAGLDLTKAEQMTPDWVTWNGYAAQYKTHPLTAQPGQTVRFWVVDAGPSLNTDFHVVGTILNRAWLNADLRDAPQHDVQTALVPAGGGGVFDVRITRPGIYPFVSHSFASVMLGEVGLLNVGNVAGTMSH